MVLGISPKLPRRVVGSRAFQNLQDTVRDLLQKVHLRIDAVELDHPDGRVVVFGIPSRPIGMPIEVGGTYWMRAGESLTGMTPEVLKKIFDETVPDFSADVCKGALLGDLDSKAIEIFRKAWAKKTQKPAIEKNSDAQVLADAELMMDGAVTYAALILFGKGNALGRWLPQAEVVFEYRSSEATGTAQQRLDLRSGFFSFYEILWQAIAARNEIQHYRDGLFIWDIPTFEETMEPNQNTVAGSQKRWTD